MEVVHKFGDNEIFKRNTELEPKDKNTVLEKPVEREDVKSPKALG